MTGKSAKTTRAAHKSSTPKATAQTKSLKTASEKSEASATSNAPLVKSNGVTEQAAVDMDLRKKELIEMVVARSGAKKKDAKPVIEAMLAVLGETVASGRELNLQPFGKLKINRRETKANGRVVMCRLRQPLK